MKARGSRQANHSIRDLVLFTIAASPETDALCKRAFEEARAHCRRLSEHGVYHASNLL